MACYVFGYGSLAGERDGSRPGTLHGFRRTWDVAMDNSVDLPGYKFYVEPGTRRRPPLYVAYLNLRPAAGETNGVLLPVAPGAMEELDARERNYRRVDVGDRITGAPPGARVWTYVGTDAARGRFRRGMGAGRAAVTREYLDRVEAGFRALGDGAVGAFVTSTDPMPCPVVELDRIDLP